MMRKVFLLAITLMLIAGCKVGPSFVAPSPKKTDGYGVSINSEVENASGDVRSEMQHFHLGRDAPREWWGQYRSGQLDHLVQLALAKNPGLVASKARFDNARHLLDAGRGVVWPSVTGNYQANHTKEISQSNSRATQNLFQGGISINYVFDIFGGNRRAIEALEAQVNFAEYQDSGARLTLVGNVITGVISLASTLDQIVATREIIVEEEKQCDLVEARLNAGTITDEDVASSRAQLETSKAKLAILMQQAEVTRHALIALLGETPASFSIDDLSLNDLTLPHDVPVALPSALVQQRPDIRAQEALLHSAYAKVGVATANLFPQISLTGNYTKQSQLSGLLSKGATEISIGGNIAQTLFDRGTLLAQRKATVDTLEEMKANYRTAVLTAFNNVSDALSALQHDEESCKRFLSAMNYSEVAVTRTEYRFAEGVIDYTTLLQQQQQYQQARISYIQASAQRLSDTALLFQALGGDWWSDLSAVSSATQ